MASVMLMGGGCRVVRLAQVQILDRLSRRHRLKRLISWLQAASVGRDSSQSQSRMIDRLYLYATKGSQVRVLVEVIVVMEARPLADGQDLKTEMKPGKDDLE